MNAQTRASMVRGQRNAQRTWDCIRSNPGIDTAFIEAALHISRSTLNRYLADFLQLGMIRESVKRRKDDHVRIRYFSAKMNKPYERTPHWHEIPPVDTTERRSPEHHWTEYRPGRWYQAWRDADKLAYPEDYK